MDNSKSNLLFYSYSMHKVVNDLDTFFNDTVKQLHCYSEEIKEHLHERTT